MKKFGAEFFLQISAARTTEFKIVCFLPADMLASPIKKTTQNLSVRKQEAEENCTVISFAICTSRQIQGCC